MRMTCGMHMEANAMILRTGFGSTMLKARMNDFKLSTDGEESNINALVNAP